MVRTEKPEPASQEQQTEDEFAVSELVDRIVARETERLEARAERLRQRFEQLVDDYPSARKLAGEIESVVGEHRRFAESIDEIGWGRRRSRIGDQLAQVLRDRSEESVLSLAWDPEQGVFYADVDSAVWRARRESPTIDVAAVVEDDIEVAVETGEVSYPIVFSQELESNHRAVLRAVGWGLVAEAARRRLGDIGSVHKIRLDRGDEQIAVEASSGAPVFRLPGARAFGYSPEGELWRRLGDFDQTDPDAHWIRWIENGSRARREIRILREKGGAQLRVELDVRLRRLRVVEQPASEIVRNRRHVFVDEVRARTRDRLFADEARLREALREVLSTRIGDGFRIVYERIESDDQVRERGRRPRSDRHPGQA